MDDLLRVALVQTDIVWEDKARNREKGGYGLGLAIAKSIVEKHHGKIAASQTEEDIQFTVTLPVKEHRQKKKLLPVRMPGSGKE